MKNLIYLPLLISGLLFADDYEDEDYFFQSEENVMFYFNMWEEEVEDGVRDIRIFDTFQAVESDESLFKSVANEKYHDMAKYIIYYKKHGELHPHIKLMMDRYAGDDPKAQSYVQDVRMLQEFNKNYKFRGSYKAILSIIHQCCSTMPSFSTN